MALAGGFAVEGDLASFLVGTWRRSLEVRRFGGGFDPLRPSNSFVVIEPAPGAAPEPGTRFLNWFYSNASTLTDDVRHWVCMQCVPTDDGRTQLEWVWRAIDPASGEAHSHVCTGWFDPAVSVLTLTFDCPGQSVVYTFRITDANTMSLCVVTVTAQEVPKIQYGHMIRLADPLTR